MLGVYDYTVVLTYVLQSPAFVICLMERLQEQKRTGQKWKSVSESRLIR